MTGIKTVSKSQLSLFTYYPNPTNDVVFIETDAASFKVSLYNYQGKCVSMSENNKTISLKEFSNGLYFIRFQSGDLIEQSKVILQK